MEAFQAIVVEDGGFKHLRYSLRLFKRITDQNNYDYGKKPPRINLENPQYIEIFLNEKPILLHVLNVSSLYPSYLMGGNRSASPDNHRYLTMG